MNPGATGMTPPKTKISGYNVKQIPQFTPQMQQLFQSLLSSLSPGTEQSGDFLSKLAMGDEDMFNQLEKPAYSSFEKLLGNIGTRFSDLGARDSSYFENAVSGAGADLAQNLQSQRLGLRQNAIQSLLGHSEQLLSQRPYESIITPKEPSLFDKYLQFASNNFGTASRAAAGGF